MTVLKAVIASVAKQSSKTPYIYCLDCFANARNDEKAKFNFIRYRANYPFHLAMPINF